MHMTTQTTRLRRSLFQTAILLFLAVAGNWPAVAAEPPARKPNFIFLFVDDASWGDLGCFGHPYAKTPNLDKMAADGIKLTKFYVCAAECAPSRSALITGRIPDKAGKNQNNGPRLNPNLPNVYNLLKPAGYSTGHFGKWHLYNGFKDPPATEWPQYGIDAWYMASANTHNADTARLTTDAALAFMDGHTNTPFHMNVWYVWPHGPTNPNGAQSAVYDDVLNPDDVAKRVDITKFHPTMQAKYAMAMKNHPHFDLTANMKTYLATITEIDKQIGRILAKLEALGLAQDTLVVYSSDNGAEVRGIDKPSDSSGSPMWAASAGTYFGGKFQWYDGGVRMTCLAQWKERIPAGQTNDSLWRAVDWLPTVCALAGVKTGGITLDGQNVADILLGNQRERTEPLFESVYKIKTVHEGRWKWYEHKLFDLETDVSEQNNLASQQSARAKRMLSMHSQWMANTLPLAVVTGEANPDRGGITSGGAAYMVGSNAVLVATAWKGWHFTGWNDGVKNNPRTIMVPATNITYTANFERK